MNIYSPSPDEINLKNGAHYRCRPCGATSGLHWYRGTSCPVCSKPECTQSLNEEWAQMEREMRRSDGND